MARRALMSHPPSAIRERLWPRAKAQQTRAVVQLRCREMVTRRACADGALYEESVWSYEGRRLARARRGCRARVATRHFSTAWSLTSPGRDVRYCCSRRAAARFVVHAVALAAHDFEI